ncbi:MAG: DUF2752 domain-containing protein [Deltaproteobacteria bacterium]|nr:DUF2752 domain-containing protein [Deltaproteobacteria bacterium]
MTTIRNESPGATLSTRLIWLGIVAGSVAVLAVALAIEPDVRGHGTHTQLGLPPCGFLLLTGSPCPGCGLTTAFAHGIRGQWSMAASANPLGLALFFVVSACIPLGLAAALRSWSIGEVVDRFGLNRWALAVAGCAIVVWFVRFAVAL